MKHISRRVVLHFAGVLTSIGLIGCTRNRGRNSEPQPVLELHPETEPTDTGWNMDIWIRHTSDRAASIHDVTVIAFSNHGEEVCRIDVGDFPQGGRFEERESVTCDTFPAIVSATAQESPCDGASIWITYLAESGEEGEPIAWDNTPRECDESLPPERVIKEVSKPPTHDN